MASKIASNEVDTLLKNLLNSDKPFGNLIVIVSRYYRPTLPIVRHGNGTQIIDNTVERSNLREYFNKISLTKNHRLKHADDSSDNGFCQLVKVFLEIIQTNKAKIH